MFGNRNNMPNMGMNMLNWGVNMPNMGMNNPNMGMNMPNMGMNMPNMGMNMPNMGIIQGMNEEWIKGYQMGYNEVMNGDKVNNPPPVNPNIDLVNIVFNTTQGMTKNLPFEREKTVSELIKAYLNRVGKPELFKRTKDICFICNGNKIDIHSKETVGQYFTGNINPKIIVNDVKNLIGAKKNCYYLY